MTDQPVRVQLSRRAGWGMDENTGKDERIPDGTGLSSSTEPSSRPSRASIPCAAAAEAFARDAHAGQTDKAGLPYAGHLMRVAARARAHAEVISREPEFASLCEQVGWLHDVIEDTPMIAQNLRDAGFDSQVVNAVQRLTHHASRSYLDYVRAIILSGDPIAMVVKLADNEDNLDPSRPATPLVSASLLDRCSRSRAMLLKALGLPASGIAAAQPPEPKGLAEGKSPAPSGETPKAKSASIKVVEVSNG